MIIAVNEPVAPDEQPPRDLLRQFFPGLRDGGLLPVGLD